MKSVLECRLLPLRLIVVHIPALNVHNGREKEGRKKRCLPYKIRTIR